MDIDNRWNIIDGNMEHDIVKMTNEKEKLIKEFLIAEEKLYNLVKELTEKNRKADLRKTKLQESERELIELIKELAELEDI